MKKSLLLVFLSLCCFSISIAAEETPSPVGDQQSQNGTLVNKAVELYAAKRYDEAAELFKQALEMQEEPEIIYNIARCYERAANPEEAIEWYRKFLETPGTTGELRSKALTNIAALKKELAAIEAMKQVEKTEAGPADSTVSENEPPAGVNPKRGENLGDSPNTSGPTPDSSAAGVSDSSSGAMRVAGWTLVGIGVAAMAAGGVFGVLAIQSKNDFDSAGTAPYRLEYQDDVKRNALIFDILFPIGAVSAVIGTTSAVIGMRRKHSRGASSERSETAGLRARRTQFAPSLVIADGNPSFSLIGRF